MDQPDAYRIQVAYLHRLEAILLGKDYIIEICYQWEDELPSKMRLTHLLYLIGTCSFNFNDSRQLCKTSQGEANWQGKVIDLENLIGW